MTDQHWVFVLSPEDSVLLSSSVSRWGAHFSKLGAIIRKLKVSMSCFSTCLWQLGKDWFLFPLHRTAISAGCYRIIKWSGSEGTSESHLVPALSAVSRGICPDFEVWDFKMSNYKFCPIEKNDLSTLSLKNAAELHSFTSADTCTPSNTSAGICNSHSYLGSAHLSDYSCKALWV